MASLNSLDRRGNDRKTRAANNENKTTRRKEVNKTDMEHEELRYDEKVRSIFGDMKRIVERMDDVYYSAETRETRPLQFFVLNMITQARRLRNDWQRFVNNDKTILDEFDRWKDRLICEQIQKRVQANETEHKSTMTNNREMYEYDEKAGPPKLPNDLRCWNYTRQGKKCNFDPYYKCVKHSKFARLQKGIHDDATIPPSVVANYTFASLSEDSDDVGYVNKVDHCLLMTEQCMAMNIPVVGDEHAYKLNRYGQPEMPSITESPLMYVYIKWNPIKEGNHGAYHKVQTKPFKALALPDSGSTRNICTSRFAAKCNLEIDTNDKVKVYTANSQMLECEGATRAVLSYFGRVMSAKIYIMKGISDEFLILSRRTCQALQILPMEFPLPLHKCDFAVMEVPSIHEDPFHNKGLHQPNPFPHEDFVMESHGEREPTRPPMPKSRKVEIAGELGNECSDSTVRILTSFNDPNVKLSSIEKVNKLLSKYPRVFNVSIRKNIKVPQVKLRFRNDVTVKPFKTTSSKPIPYALRHAAKKEINEQIQLGIIARVPPEKEIQWCSRGMILEKPNGGRDVRLVVDAREFNEFLERDAYPMQSPKELVKQIPPTSKFFLSVDFYKGYYQIPLAEEDQLKTTFMLHGMGLYYFKKLPQGGKCSVDQFNRITDELVLNIPNCLKMVDDVMIHGTTADDVLEGFEKLLKICYEKDVTLHPKKVAFGNRLKFAGYTVSDKGICIDPRKVEAIRGFEPPKNVTDMKAFIGVAVQFQETCPNLMGALKPLIDTTSHKLTPMRDENGKKIKNPKREIVWNENLKEHFHKVKKLLTDADGTVLTPFNPNLPLEIYTDASRLNGYGWVAIQEVNGRKKLIECGSCTINDSTKRNFSVSELELAAVEMALRKMRLMTVANEKIIVKTDHLPLLGILNKPLEKIETKRLMKLAERLQDYSFTIEYVLGNKNEVADALSRNPVVTQSPGEQYVENRLMVNLVSEFQGKEVCSMKQLKVIAKNDKDYNIMKEALQANITAKDIPPDHPARPYKADWNLLAVDHDLITIGDRILVPKGARKDILRGLHLSHLGLKKTASLAKTLYYWKNMRKEIEQLIDGCEKCQVHARFQAKESLQQTFAEGPMHMNSADIAQYGNKTYLVHSDRYSNFLWIYHLKATSTKAVIDALWDTFYLMGFPDRLRTDNGPQFTSQEFIDKCDEFNIEQEWSDPHYPTSNGHAERMVGVAKALIKKSNNESNLKSMLQIYNSTPSSDTGISPAEMLMQRKLRTCLPTMTKSKFVPQSKIRVAERRKFQKAIQTKHQYDRTAKDLPPLSCGTMVRVYNHKTSRWDIIGKITFRDLRTGRSYRIRTTNDVYIFRNRRYIKPISQFDNVPNR